MSLSRCSGGWEKGRAGFRLAVVSIPEASAREQSCKLFFRNDKPVLHAIYVQICADFIRRLALAGF